MSNSWYFFSINSSRSVDCDRKKRFPVSVNTTVVNKYILLYNSILYSTRFYVPGSHVASNSVLFAESVDTTSDSVVRQRGEELLGETYGRRNRRRNVYASLAV